MANKDIKVTTEDILEIISDNPRLADARMAEIIMSEFSVSKPTAYKYLHSADDEIKKKTSKDLDKIMGSFYRKYEALIDINEKIEDWKEIRAILKDYSEMLGVRTQKIEMQADLKILLGTSDEL